MSHTQNPPTLNPRKGLGPVAVVQCQPTPGSVQSVVDGLVARGCQGSGHALPARSKGCVLSVDVRIAQIRYRPMAESLREAPVHGPW